MHASRAFRCTYHGILCAKQRFSCALLTLNLLLDTKSVKLSGLQHRRQCLLVAKSSSLWDASTNVGGCLSIFYICEAVLAVYPAAELTPV